MIPVWLDLRRGGLVLADKSNHVSSRPAVLIDGDQIQENKKYSTYGEGESDQQHCGCQVHSGDNYGNPRERNRRAVYESDTDRDGQADPDKTMTGVVSTSLHHSPLVHEASGRDQGGVE